MRRASDHLPEPQVVLASLLSLMTSFVRTGCPRMAVLIRRQLAYLQSFPESMMPASLKTIARRLEDDWDRIAEREVDATGAPDRPHLH